jgi:hypothetical protein
MDEKAMSENRGNPWQKVSETDNKLLNILGNICGRIANLFLKPYIRWGTMYEYTFDLEEDIDKEKDF